MHTPIATPNTKPRLASNKLRELIAPFDIDREKHPLVVVGIRGYYLNTLGKKGANDREIYDDALFIDSIHITASFNANTDPSYVRRGAGRGRGKGMAKLNPGHWPVYVFGKHRGKYLALVQRVGPVTVTRDGTPDYEDTGMFGINIHKGGITTTSSLGCQTIHPFQWREFIVMASGQAKRFFGADWDKTPIPYILIDETIRL